MRNGHKILLIIFENNQFTYRKAFLCSKSLTKQPRKCYIRQGFDVKLRLTNGECRFVLIIEPSHDETNKMTFALSEDSDQPDQGLCYPREETLGPLLPTERTTKTLIRLGGCPS